MLGCSMVGTSASRSRTTSLRPSPAAPPPLARCSCSNRSQADGWLMATLRSGSRRAPLPGLCHTGGRLLFRDARRRLPGGNASDATSSGSPRKRSENDRFPARFGHFRAFLGLFVRENGLFRPVPDSRLYGFVNDSALSAQGLGFPLPFS